MTPEARAGSTLNLFNVIGINIPAIPAINKFIIIAIAITIPNKKSSNQYEESNPIINAKIIPLIPPTNVSFTIILNALEVVNSFIAKALTETVKVCVPALPPIEATIGINTASATAFSIEA